MIAGSRLIRLSRVVSSEVGGRLTSVGSVFCSASRGGGYRAADTVTEMWKDERRRAVVHGVRPYLRSVQHARTAEAEVDGAADSTAAPRRARCP